MKIGICGKMCSGKSTLAGKIINQYKNIYKEDCKKDSLANKVYELAYELFEMKEKDRFLLQQIGTKMRDIDKDVWIKYIIKKHKNTDNIIIDDVRYINEILELKNNGYFIIRLEISPELQEKRIKELYKNNSEQHLINRNHESEIISYNRNNILWDLVINVDKDNIDTIISTLLS